MVECSKGYRHHYQHEQHVRDTVVDVQHDVGVDVADSSGIAGNV